MDSNVSQEHQFRSRRFPYFSIMFSSTMYFLFILLPIYFFSNAPEPNIIILLIIVATFSALSVSLGNYILIFFNSVVFFFIVYPFYIQGFFRFRYLLGGQTDVESQTLFLFLLFFVIANIITILSARKATEYFIYQEDNEVGPRSLSSLRATIIAVFVLISVIIIFGYEHIFLPRQRNVFYGFERPGNFEKFFIGIMKTIPYWLLYFYIITNRNYSITRILLGAFPIAFFALLISNPINTQRFLSLFGILVIFFAFVRIGKFSSLWRNSYAMVAAGLIILPITSFMRSGQIVLDPEALAQSLFSLEFSAFSLLNDLFVIQYRASGEPVRLLSAALIFIPRAIWPSKNEGTGTSIAESAGYWFQNVGIPPIADAYLDFGIFGVVFLGVIAGFALRGASNFLSMRRSAKSESLIGIKISFIALIPIFLRGDLSTAFIAFYTSIIAFYVAKHSCRLGI